MEYSVLRDTQQEVFCPGAPEAAQQNVSCRLTAHISDGPRLP
jgi:hypothetical protein